jgi:multiple antibiotic resistance protein
MKQFLLAFIPIFVAVDAIGILPIFLSLTQGIPRKERNHIIIQSIWTAIIVAFGFIILGKWIFALLGITMGDFMVAGGLVLFCIAIMDLLVSGKKRRVPSSELGAVPLGTPLIVGPAVLTTCLIVISQHGILMTALSVILNVLIAALLFYFSDSLTRVFGKAGATAMSKIMALLLAAIAVMMIRKGIVFIIGM